MLCAFMYADSSVFEMDVDGGERVTAVCHRINLIMMSLGR